MPVIRPRERERVEVEDLDVRIHTLEERDAVALVPAPALVVLFGPAADAALASQVSTLTLTQPAAATASSQGLSLAGVTYSYDGVARLLARMSLIPDLTNVELKSSSTAQGIVTFTIGAGVKGAPVPVSPVAPPSTDGTTTTTSGTSS